MREVTAKAAVRKKKQKKGERHEMRKSGSALHKHCAKKTITSFLEGGGGEKSDNFRYISYRIARNV